MTHVYKLFLQKSFAHNSSIVKMCTNCKYLFSQYSIVLIIVKCPTTHLFQTRWLRESCLDWQIWKCSKDSSSASTYHRSDSNGWKSLCSRPRHSETFCVPDRRTKKINAWIIARYLYRGGHRPRSTFENNNIKSSTITEEDFLSFFV